MEIPQLLISAGDFISSLANKGLVFILSKITGVSDVISRVLLILIFALLVFVGSKLANKLAKWIIILTSIILLVLVILTFFP